MRLFRARTGAESIHKTKRVTVITLGGCGSLRDTRLGARHMSLVVSRVQVYACIMRRVPTGN